MIKHIAFDPEWVKFATDVRSYFFASDGIYHSPAAGFNIIFIVTFAAAALLRCFISAGINKAWIGFFPCVQIGVLLIAVNVVSAIGTAILGFLVIYAIIFQAISPYYMLAIAEVIILVGISLVPGYFFERKKLEKYIEDKKVRSRFAMTSAIYFGLLTLALIYGLYSVGMNYY